MLLRLLLGKRPITSAGELRVAGLRGSVHIRRDAFGIPYIEAREDADAWFGLGFCQGQDRAFQLEGLLRVVRGTVAELVGAQGVAVDRMSRRLGLRRSAAEQIDLLDAEDRDMLDAFARGVSEGARGGAARAAHEFALLRTRPTPYDAVDVLAMSKLLGFALSANWDIELARLRLLTEEGPEALAALDPVYPEWHGVSVPGTVAGPALDRLAQDMATFSERAGVGGYSNNWTVASSRSATGRPLVANDPHLDPVLPNHWYLAHVRTPRWAVAGATFAGTPAVAAGHNGSVAWGVTAALVDNTDLFIEQLGPDGRSVRSGEGFVACETRSETIEVKGGEPVHEQVILTPRGPIISPALDVDAHAVSLRATWLELRPLRGVLRAHLARSCEELRGMMADWPSASFNLVCGDSSGAIAWQLFGDVPQRRAGHGTLPLPGWDPDAGWEERPVAFEELPHVENPQSGFVATANNQPIPDGSGPFLGVDWVDGYRLNRIVEALASRADWDVAATSALQLDVESLPWRELRAAVLAAPCARPEARVARSLLQGWDGKVTGDSPAAAVFELLVAELAARVVAARAPRSAGWALGRGCGPLIEFSPLAARQVGLLVRLLREQPEGWFERSWPAEVGDALAVVVARLCESRGNDPAQWSWGAIRKLTLRHPFGERRPLDRVFNLGPFEWGGDANTVSQAAPPPLEPTANPIVIASLRMVVDVGNWDESRFALPGGQSGNPLSSHYADLLPLWLAGGGVPIHWSNEAIEEHCVASLQLEPKRAAAREGS